jgi:hypothetical protein
MLSCITVEAIRLLRRVLVVWRSTHPEPQADLDFADKPASTCAEERQPCIGVDQDQPGTLLTGGAVVEASVVEVWAALPTDTQLTFGAVDLAPRMNLALSSGAFRRRSLAYSWPAGSQAT